MLIGPPGGVATVVRRRSGHRREQAGKLVDATIVWHPPRRIAVPELTAQTLIPRP